MRRASRGPLLYLNLKYFTYPGFIFFLASAPLLRGLFFPADLLPHQMIMGAILALAAFDALITRSKELVSGGFAWGFLLLAVAYGVSTFGAASKSEAFRGFLKHLMYFGAFAVSAYLSRGSRGRKVVLVTVFATATLVAAIGISSATQVFVFPGAAQSGRILSTLQYPNALAAYLMFSSILGFTLSGKTENQVARGLLSAAAFLQTLVFLASYSRGGWVIYPFAIIAFYLGMPGEYKANAAFDICAVLTAVLLVVRRFSEAIVSSSPARGLWYVGAGFVITAAFYLGRWAFRVAIGDRVGPQAAKALSWTAGVYAAATFCLYMYMMAAQHGMGISGIVPASILNRLSSISLDDPSLLTRAFSTRDAIAVFLDHPIVGGGAGAWNAFYHQYQRVLYWTTEVHNHFAQVLVETGVLGISCYIFIWGFAVFGAVRHCLRRQASPFSRAAVWGLLVACLAIGIHSAMDFELSLPGIAVQVWAIFGVLAGEIGDEGEEPLYERESARLLMAGENADSSTGRKPMVFVSSILAFMVSAGLLIPSYRLQRGAYYGGLGASALLRQDFYNAMGLYEEAKKADPLSASYSMDASQASAAMFFFDRRPELKERSLSELERARVLEPYSVPHRIKEVEILVSLGEIDKAVDVARTLPKLVPLDVRSYEIFARTAVVAATRHARSDTPTPGADQMRYVSTLLHEVIEIPGILESLRSRVTGFHREMWDPEKLTPSSALKTCVGQAYYLDGDLDRAIDLLRDASKDPAGAEAALWLEAALTLRGDLPLKRDLSLELREILSYSHMRSGS